MTTNSALAVAQFSPGADPKANLETIERLAQMAAGQGASLVVFPEYSSFFTTKMGQNWVDSSEKIDGQFATGLSTLAARLGIHVIAGMIESTTDPTRASNTVVAFAPEGELVATYRKLHLYDAFGSRESEWILAGAVEAPETFSWGGFTIGLQTCYDIRFPEVTRRLVDAGADLILLPSDWVPGERKVDQWRTLITARAIENTVYFAAADHPSPSGVGNSLIVDPAGIELVTIADGEDVAVVTVSPDRVFEVRKTNPALQLRRL